MAVGSGPIIPVITFVLTGDVHWPVYAMGLGLDLGWLHALTSLKGGGPCPLDTLNYGVAGHLAYQ